MRTLVSMREAIGDPLLLGAAFPTKPGEPDTWLAWKALALASRGEPLRPDELAAFRMLTGLQDPPTEPVEELAVIKGRRSGGTTWAAAVLAYLAGLCDYRDVLGVGERATALLLAPSQRQAEIAFGRVCGLFEASPLLNGLITNRTAESLALASGVDVEIRAASKSTLRGLTLVCCLADEASHFLADGVNADSLIMNAVRPALITTRGPLILASTPYAPTGELFDLSERYYAKPGPILVAKATSRQTNPTLSEAVIARAMERDPIAARAEFLGEFRSDVSGFISRDLIMEAVDRDAVHPRPRTSGTRYIAFADASSGLAPSADGGDAFALCLAHEEGENVIIDLVEQWKPPFSASDIIRDQIVPRLREYGVDELTTDGFSSGFVRSELARSGIGHRISELSKSELYLATLPVLTSRRLRMPELQFVIDQFLLLERRPSSAGRDRVDGKGGRSEDAANVVAGCTALLTAIKPQPGAGLLEWYRRQAEAVTTTAPQTVQETHAAEGVMQIGTRPPVGLVRINVPGHPSHIYGALGAQYLVVDGTALVSEEDARDFLSPSNIAFREANAELAQLIASKGSQGPKGIKFTDWLDAIEDARPIHPLDKGRIAARATRDAARMRPW